MMKDLIDRLHVEQCYLVVLHDGHIRTFKGRGVRRLYNLMSDEPELFLRAKIADKAVGHSAAELMVLGGVSEVYADYMSEQAYDILTEAGIKVSYGKKVDHERFLEIWVMLGEINE